VPEEVAEDIFRLQIPLPKNPLKALNSYVVKGQERNLVIDTGMRREECLEAMRAGLEAHRIKLHQAWWDGWNPLREYMKSLEKTELLDVELVLPGHRSIFTDLRGRIVELKEHHDRRAEEVLAILTEGPQTAYQVASEMTWDILCDSFDEFPLAQKWFATGEAIAHVKYLGAFGKIRGEIKKQLNQEVILWSLPG
jgi:glyoxylase-like metal-dependent hydrolase (beta-lactamase superfamily II)